MSRLLKLLPMWPEPARVIMYSVLMRHKVATNAVRTSAVTGNLPMRSNSGWPMKYNSVTLSLLHPAEFRCCSANASERPPCADGDEVKKSSPIYCMLDASVVPQQAAK